jgi:hypothetical protein
MLRDHDMDYCALEDQMKLVSNITNSPEILSTPPGNTEKPISTSEHGNFQSINTLSPQIPVIVPDQFTNHKVQQMFPPFSHKRSPTNYRIKNIIDTAKIKRFADKVKNRIKIDTSPNNSKLPLVPTKKYYELLVEFNQIREEDSKIEYTNINPNQSFMA